MKGGASNAGIALSACVDCNASRAGRDGEVRDALAVALGVVRQPGDWGVEASRDSLMK